MSRKIDRPKSPKMSWGKKRFVTDWEQENKDKLHEKRVEKFLKEVK